MFMRISEIARRSAFAWGLIVGLGWLPSGCMELQQQFGAALATGAGESAVDAELDRIDHEGPAFNRLPKGPFAVTEAHHARAVVVARGRPVAIEPVEGLCLAVDEMDTGSSGAFVVIADCITETAATADALPPSFAGLLTVSISGEPMFPADTGRASALRELRDFLGSDAGRKLLGRDREGGAATLLEARQIGDALYVRVRDGQGGRLALLDPEFWRAFVEIEDRLLLVTVSGFQDRPMDPERMLGLLAAQVARLRSANGAAAFAAEESLAERIDGVRTGAAGRTDPSGGINALRRQVAERSPPPVRAPRPAGRVVAAVSNAGSGPVEGGTKRAPKAAPVAPRRPAQG